jgi:hypothetical protein
VNCVHLSIVGQHVTTVATPTTGTPTTGSPLKAHRPLEVTMVSDRGGRWRWRPRRPDSGKRCALMDFRDGATSQLYIPRVATIPGKLKPVETKQCTGCAEIKQLEDFYRKSASRDGRATRCKVCANAVVKAWEKRNPDKLRERTYRWRNRYPEKSQAVVRRSQLKRKYGITVEQFDAQLTVQRGRCAICRTDTPGTRWGTFTVDHDHACCSGDRSCGKCLRGLLCGNCNTLLGMAGDDASRLLAAASYLARGHDGFK